MHPFNDRRHRRALIATLSVTATLASAAAAGASTITISVVPSATHVAVGETFTVDLVATLTNVDPMAELAAWGMDLSFDDSRLSHDPLTDVWLDAAWDPLGLDDDGLDGFRIPDGSGLPEFTDIALATLEFEAISPGVVDFVGSFDEFVEGFGLVIIDEQQSFMVDEVIFETASVTIVPVPSAALLAGAGLAAVGVLRRRRGS